VREAQGRVCSRQRAPLLLAPFLRHVQFPPVMDRRSGDQAQPPISCSRSTLGYLGGSLGEGGHCKSISPLPRAMLVHREHPQQLLCLQASYTRLLFAFVLRCAGCVTRTPVLPGC